MGQVVGQGPAPKKLYDIGPVARPTEAVTDGERKGDAESTVAARPPQPESSKRHRGDARCKLRNGRRFFD